MKIIFCRTLPHHSNEIHYCHFNHQDLKLHKAFFHDLKPLAEEQEKAFFSEVEIWHSSLNLQGKNQSKLWWLLPATRLMSWAPAIYTPLFFNHLLLILKQNNPKIHELYVVAAPREAITIAQDFFPEIAKLDNDAIDLVPEENFYHNHLKPYLAYLKHFLFNTLAQEKIKSRPYLIHTMILNPDNFLKGIDHYFGNNFLNLAKEQREKITFLLTYPANDKQVKKAIIDFLNQHSFQVIFTYDALKLADVFNLILMSITQKLKTKKLAKTLPPILIGKIKSHHFSKIYGKKILEQKQDALMELELILAARKYLPELSPQKILFAYEERSLEHALLLANSELKKPAKTYGFVHAVMHPGHLCYNLKSIKEANPPRPDFVLTTGSAPAEWFVEKGLQNSQVKLMGSPRCQLSFTPAQNLSVKKKILFLEGQNHELIEFAGWLVNNPKLLDQFSLTIRPKPYISLSEKKLGLELIQKILPDVKEEGGNLSQQLKQYDVVFYSTSSAGIEAILSGKMAFYLKLDQFLNLNPLDSLHHPQALVACKNAQDLTNSLNKIQKLNTTEWNDLIQRQMKEAQLIYQPFSAETFLN